MLRQWTLNNAWSGSCVCDGVMAPCSAVVWPPGRHESSVQSCSACRWAHNSCRQLCRQLSSVIRCADNFVLPFVSYTLFTVVNFRCADLRLLFFPVHKAVFTYNIETTLCCLVSVYSRLVQSFASLVFRCAVMSCLLSCLLSAVEKWK